MSSPYVWFERSSYTKGFKSKKKCSKVMSFKHQTFKKLTEIKKRKVFWQAIHIFHSYYVQTEAKIM